MRQREPGEMGADAWMGRSDVAYHGTFHPDWDRNDMLHLGSLASAQQRLQHLSRGGIVTQEEARNYLHPDYADTTEWDDEEPPEVPDTLHGRIFPRRVSDVASGAPFEDRALNRGQAEWMDEGGESVPASIRQSARNGDRAAAGRVKDALDRGQSVRYENMSEDQGSTSILAPRMNTHSWEGDVLNARHASPMSQQFARDRLHQGKELTAPVNSFNEITATQPVLYNGSNIFNVYDKQHVMRRVNKAEFTVHPNA